MGEMKDGAEETGSRKRRAVVGPAALGGAALLAAMAPEQANAAVEVAQMAASDNRLGAIALLFGKRDIEREKKESLLFPRPPPGPRSPPPLSPPLSTTNSARPPVGRLQHPEPPHQPARPHERDEGRRRGRHQPPQAPLSAPSSGAAAPPHPQFFLALSARVRTPPR
jgi:hypothetical protein